VATTSVGGSVPAPPFEAVASPRINVPNKRGIKQFAWRFIRMSSSAGITRIRFEGLISAVLF
jgi:hypothetical protein